MATMATMMTMPSGIMMPIMAPTARAEVAEEEEEEEEQQQQQQQQQAAVTAAKQQP